MKEYYQNGTVSFIIDKGIGDQYRYWISNENVGMFFTPDELIHLYTLLNEYIYSEELDQEDLGGLDDVVE